MAHALWQRMPLRSLTGWARKLFSFAGIQMGIKLMGMVISLLLVRWLDKGEYALFTLANSFIATIVVLSDSGISNGLSAIGGRIWEDKTKVSSLFRTILFLRKRILIVAALLLGPFMGWMMVHNGASWTYALLLTGIGLIIVSFQLEYSIYRAFFALLKRVKFMQWGDLLQTSIRLGFLLILGLTFLNTSMMMLAILASYLVVWFLQRRWFAPDLDVEARIESAYQGEIIGIMKRQLPNNIYYCINGQLTVFLISIFGTASGTAEIGALGRLMMILSVVQITFQSLVIPQYAKVKSAGRLLTYFVIVSGTFLGIAALFWGGSLIFPGELLLLLGPKYAHLEKELSLIMLSTLLIQLTGIIFSLNASRGWILPWWLNVPFGVLFQIIGIIIFEVGTLEGVIHFQLFANAPILLINFFYFLYAFRKFRQSIGVNSSSST